MYLAECLADRLPDCLLHQVRAGEAVSCRLVAGTVLSTTPLVAGQWISFELEASDGLGNQLAANAAAAAAAASSGAIVTGCTSARSPERRGERRGGSASAFIMSPMLPQVMTFDCL